jgi:hypothetical protein
MADYFTRTLVQQCIPLSDITPLELLLLLHMFSLEDGEATGHFCTWDGPAPIVSVPAGDLRAATDASRGTESRAMRRILDHYGDVLIGEGDIELDLSDNFWITILQDIVARSRALTHISVTMSFTCSKLRPDGFGGAAMLITANCVRSTSTHVMLDTFIRRATRKGEIPPPPELSGG